MWNSVVTNVGAQLLAQWAGGGTLTITGATAGTGTVPVAQLMACTAMSGSTHTLSIIGHSEITNGVTYQVQLQATTEAYTAMQIGIWARLNSGPQTLIAIYQADSGEGIHVPAYADMPDFAIQFASSIEMDNTGSYSVTVDTTALVSQGQLAEALARITPANIGAKATQAAVSSPVASGTAVAFIDSISQDSQGVISPTKKNVTGASQSAAGLMSADDKKKLDGIAVGAQVNSITGVKGNAESNYRTGNVNITPANIGAKATQAAVSSPVASGTAVAFIDSISQDSQGVISPTKKNVTGASQSAAGLMSADDKKKLDGIDAGAQVNSITGVKGNAESSYRTGNVNLTPANIGAFGINSANGTITDANNINLYGTRFFQANQCSNLPTNVSGVYYQVEFMGVFQMAVEYAGENARPIYSRYFANNKWYSWQKIVDINTSGLVTAAGGGTGANNAAEARSNLGITPANIHAAYAINIASDVNTWSGIFQALSELPNYTTGTIYAGSAPASKLTGGKLASYINGVVTRMSDNVFDFMVQSGANPAYMYSFRVEGLTSSAGTPGTVYRFAGTAI